MEQLKQLISAELDKFKKLLNEQSKSQDKGQAEQNQAEKSGVPKILRSGRAQDKLDDDVRNVVASLSLEHLRTAVDSEEDSVDQLRTAVENENIADQLDTAEKKKPAVPVSD